MKFTTFFEVKTVIVYRETRKFQPSEGYDFVKIKSIYQFFG